MFCIYLRTNSDLCHLQHKRIGFYNRDEKCLLRHMNWVFKKSSLRFVFKGLTCVLSYCFCLCLSDTLCVPLVNVRCCSVPDTGGSFRLKAKSHKTFDTEVSTKSFCLFKISTWEGGGCSLVAPYLIAHLVVGPIFLF